MQVVMYTGQMKVNVTEFKATCLSLIDRVRSKGEVVTITKRGRVVAKLVSAVETDVKPWLALRRQPATFNGVPFAPVVEDDDIEAYK
jgi:prevent-host-death family protein